MQEKLEPHKTHTDVRKKTNESTGTRYCTYIDGRQEHIWKVEINGNDRRKHRRPLWMQKTRDQSLQAKIIISHARFEPRMVENAKHPDCSQHALEHTSHYGTVQPIYWEHFQQTSANTPTSPHTSALQWIKQELWSSASDYFLNLNRNRALPSQMTFNRGTVHLYYTSILI